MIDFDEALSLVRDSAEELGMEEVRLEESLGRVLYERAVSDVDLPPFDKSAMDGFACRYADLGGDLRVIETVPAGKMPGSAVGRGECARIMTGAPVPEGADIVVMVEDTEEEGGLVRVVRKRDKRNICLRGEDIAAGSTVLERGARIGPAQVAVLAAAGYGRVKVFRRPRIGIAATGDELIEPGETCSGAVIRNSNSYQLCAQAAAAGFSPSYLGIIEDTVEALEKVLEEDSGRFDVMIFSGGVSAGDYDHVPSVLKKDGFELLFEKVAVKPGKPTVFGRKGRQYVFGLPGNPVSTFVLFELLVKPFCHLLMGHEYGPVTVRGTMAESYVRKGASRTSHIPVRIDGEGSVSLVEYHGSAHIHALAGADGIISVPSGAREVKAGEKVDVILFDLRRAL